jgi:hypothetical protein
MIKPRMTAERAKRGSSKINDLAHTTDDHGRLAIEGTHARAHRALWQIVRGHPCRPWSETDA